MTSSKISRTPQILYYDAEISGFTNSGHITVTLTDDRFTDSDEFVLKLDEGEVRPFADALIEVSEQDRPDVSDIPHTPVSSISVAESQITAYIVAGKAVSLDYTKEDGDRVVRVVSPYLINTIKDGSSLRPPKYLQGWEHDNAGIRNFRLSRINGIAPAAEDFRPERI